MLYPKLNDASIETSSYPLLPLLLTPLCSPPSLGNAEPGQRLRMPTYPALSPARAVGAAGDPSCLRWLSVVLKDGGHIGERLYDVRSPQFLPALSWTFPAARAAAASAMRERMCCAVSFQHCRARAGVTLLTRLSHTQQTYRTPNCPKPCVCLYVPVELTQFNGTELQKIIFENKSIFYSLIAFLFSV